MKHLIKLLILIMGVTMLNSCVKEELVDFVTRSEHVSQRIITTNVHGQIIDKNDVPIQNATVVYHSGGNDVTVQTDEFGSFIFENVGNRGASAFLSVESSGKFKAFRRFGVLEGRYNYTVVKMNDKKIHGSVDATSGGIVEDNNGAKVNLPAGGIVTANGVEYKGNVNVAMSWIDPSRADLPQRTVGDLSGIDLEARQRSLMSYGMLQVELQDENGAELNLAEGQKAELTFPVPQTMMSTALDEIPFWIYNEVVGTWVQEGIAVLVEGNYIAQTPHFSSFNVDFMTDPIEVTGVVNILTVDGDTFPASYLQIFVCSERISGKGGNLCDDGAFRFYNFPKDEVFTLKIKDACGEVIYEEEYGPYTEDTHLGVINVQPTSNFVSFKGTAVDCDLVPIEQGVIYLETESRRMQFPVVDGVFNYGVDMCDVTEAEVRVVDVIRLLESDNINISINNSINDLGEIVLCDLIAEYLTLKIDPDVNVLYDQDVSFELGRNGQGLFLTKLDTFENNYLDLTIAEVDLPVSPANNITVQASSFTYTNLRDNNELYYYLKQGVQSIDITFEEYNTDVGGRMKGSYIGKCTNEITDAEDDVSGSFDFTIK